MPALERALVSVLAATGYAAVAAAAATPGISASGTFVTGARLDQHHQPSLSENLFTVSAVDYITVDGVRTGSGASRSLLHGCHGKGRKKKCASV